MNMPDRLHPRRLDCGLLRCGLLVRRLCFMLLAAVLFIMMKSDIDDGVDGSGLGSFADNTKVR